MIDCLTLALLAALLVLVLWLRSEVQALQPEDREVIAGFTLLPSDDDDEED